MKLYYTFYLRKNFLHTQILESRFGYTGAVRDKPKMNEDEILLNHKKYGKKSLISINVWIDHHIHMQLYKNSTHSQKNVKVSLKNFEFFLMFYVNCIKSFLCNYTKLTKQASYIAIPLSLKIKTIPLHKGLQTLPLSIFFYLGLCEGYGLSEPLAVS